MHRYGRVWHLFTRPTLLTCHVGNGTWFYSLYGGMAEWLKAAVLKTVERKLRGFESYSLRHYLFSKKITKNLWEGFSFVQFRCQAQFLTAGIHWVFRGLKFESDAELVQKGVFFKGLGLEVTSEMEGPRKGRGKSGETFNRLNTFRVDLVLWKVDVRLFS